MGKNANINIRSRKKRRNTAILIYHVHDILYFYVYMYITMYISLPIVTRKEVPKTFSYRCIRNHYR